MAASRAPRWWLDALIFVATMMAGEVVVMFILPVLLPGLGGPLAALADAVMLSVVVSPILAMQLWRRNNEWRLAARVGEFERLAMVAERTTNAVAITDARRRITWINEGFTRITGFTLEESVGKSPAALVQFSKTDPNTVAAMRKALNAGKAFRGEILNRGKSGREYWLDVDIQPLHDPNGVLTGFVAIESDITEQVTERNRLNSIFSAMAEGIILQDAAGTLIECNPAAEKILGLTAAQMTGRVPTDPRWGAIREDGSPWPGNEHPAMVTLRTGQPARAQIMGIRTPEGALRWLSISTEALRDAEGVITAAVSTFADITSRREQENRLDLAVRGAGLGTWDWNITTGAVNFSQRWAQMLGYELEDIAPDISSWERLVHPDDLPGVKQALADHLEGRTPEYRFETRLRRKDGTWAWVLDSGQVTDRDAQGKPVRAAGIHLDISTAKELAIRLGESKARVETALREVSALRTALDEHSIISVADHTGTIIEVNTGFCRISGYDREELIGRNHRMLNSGIQSKAFWVDVWRTIASGRAWRGEVCNRAKDGSLYWVDSTIVPCRGTDGAIEKFVSIRFDITRQKLVESELRDARTQADAANRSKSEFLANMSHEIRTPMTAILGFTELLADSLDLAKAPRQHQDHIDTIRRNGEHLLSIINDILDISKIEAGKLTVENVPTSPHQILHDVLTLMSVKARAKGVILESIDETPLPNKIHTDPVRLRQILVNLVGNAIKFTEIGGVTVRVGFDCREGGLLHFAIEDTGIGLTSEQCQRLFTAFSQADASTSRKYGGTGLGLQICKRLVEMLGGRIDVSSTPGKGSTFSFTIRTGNISTATMIEPERQFVDPSAAARPKAHQEAPRETLPLEGVRILLAEDGPDNIRLISFHLKKAGANVRCVQNGKLAVPTMTTDSTLGAPLINPPPVDLIITDIQMPEMDGYASTRFLREKGCQLPIIALTAHAMEGDADKCFAAGCDGYATKPVDRNNLIRACLAALEHSKARGLAA